MDNYFVEGSWIYCRIVFPDRSEFGSLVYHNAIIGDSIAHLKDNDFIKNYTSYSVRAFSPVVRFWWGQ